MNKAAGCALSVMFLVAMVGCVTAPETDSQRKSLVDESASTLKGMIAQDSSVEHFVHTSYGYAMFPDVGKGAIIAGGAYGRGVVYEKGKMVGYADLSQATLGLQLGGQSYSELIVFETRNDLDRFVAGKMTFAANFSAVALNSGEAGTARYTDGVAVFVQPSGGLMLEFAVGGQQFTFQPK
jgi:lipid-binding SYLF domain-containing protein